MIQGVHKFRTDIRRTKREQHKADQRIFDMQINRICRLILFVKYLFTFRMQEAQGKPYMCTSDIATWIGVDNKWYYVYRPGVSTSIIPLLELTKDEDEMFDYLKDISEFEHENPHN